MVTDSERKICELKEKVRCFCEERDWDQFHTAKDIAIGIITEASELLEHFRFKTEEDAKKMFSDPKKREEIEDELADVLMFVCRMAQKYKIDLSEAFERKIEKSCKKYPVDKAKGSNKKYNEF